MELAVDMHGMAYAGHDTIGVQTLHIVGWPGAVHTEVTDESWLKIEAPKRYANEHWTFAREKSGVMTCSSSLLGSPSLREIAKDENGQRLVMTIWVPEARWHDLFITINA